LTTDTTDTAAGTEQPGHAGGFWRGFGQLLQAPPGTPWHRHPRVALSLIVGAIMLTVFVGFLGPSIATLTLGPRDGSLTPPWYLPGLLKPNPWLIAALCWLLVLMGAVGTWIALRALAVGWRPDNKRLYIGAIGLNLATITVPPLTSADVLMYSAYGRLAALGFDPYVTSPAEVFRMQWDPVLRWTERPWQDTVNVYGPLLYWMQWLASKLGGDNMHDTVFWLQVFCCLFFIGACSVVIWLARGNDVLQSRAIIWTLGGPVMIWAVVAGAHNEAVSIFFAVLAFALVRRNPLLAGVLVGVACTGKATVGLYGVAIAWAYRREIKKFLLFLLGAAVPNIIVYIILYPTALELASKNASYVAGSSWIHPVRRLLEPFLDFELVSMMMSVLAWGSAVVIGWMLSRLLPWRALPGAPEGVAPERDPLVIAVRTTVVIAAGWVITSAYSLAWYDLIYFLPMALLGATKLDLIALGRVAVLNLAYVLGRVISYSPVMAQTNQRIREVFSTSVSIGVIVAVVLWWHEHGLKVGSHTRAPRAGDETDEPAIRSS
jgi:alpha-1,6-mannosyltransferase